MKDPEGKIKVYGPNHQSSKCQRSRILIFHIVVDYEGSNRQTENSLLPHRNLSK